MAVQRTAKTTANERNAPPQEGAMPGRTMSSSNVVESSSATRKPRTHRNRNATSKNSTKSDVPRQENGVAKRKPRTKSKSKSNRIVDGNNVANVANVAKKHTNNTNPSDQKQSQRIPLKFRVHRSRQVDHMPSTITSIAHLDDLIAVARENGNTQIYCIKERGWFLERTLFGNPESSIEQVIWIDPLRAAERRAARKANADDNTDNDDDDDSASEDESAAHVTASAAAERRNLLQRHVRGRLLTVHLDGRVVEWDLATSLPSSVLHTGGAIWSAKLNDDQTILACGCEDGRVRFIDVSSNSLDILRTSEKGTSRVLSIAWLGEDYVVAGGADSVIRKMHVGSGRFVLKMDVGGTETVVWELQSFTYPDSEEIGLVSGDSSGCLVWWDHSVGVPIKLMKAHEADVLTIGISPNRILSAGVDRKIVQYTLDGLHAGEKRYHTHDVRSLVYVAKPWDVLISGGVDGTLTYVPIVDFPDCKITRLPTFPHNGVVNVARNGMFSAIIDKKVTIWKTDPKSSSSAKPIARIVHQGHNISCACISDTGKRIVVCDTQSVKLYSLEDGMIKMIKATDLASSKGALSCAFTPDGLRLVIGCTDGKVVVFDAINGTLIMELKEHLTASKAPGLPSGTWDYLRDIVISKDGQWMAVADVSANIVVYSLDSMKIQVVIPSLGCPHTAIAFHDANLSVLVITLGNNVFHLYDVEDKKFTPWSRANSNKLPFRLIQRKECIMGIATLATNRNVVVLYGSSFVLFVDMSRPDESRDCIISAAKKRKLRDIATDSMATTTTARKSNVAPTVDVMDESSDSDSDMEDLDMAALRLPLGGNANGQMALTSTAASEVFHMEHRWGPLMALAFVGSPGGPPPAMLAVERPVLSVVGSLPGAFFRHQYGT